VAQGRGDDVRGRLPLEEGGRTASAEAVGTDAVDVYACLLQDRLGEGHEFAARHLTAEIGCGSEGLVLPLPEYGQAMDRVSLRVEGCGEVADVQGPVGQLRGALANLALRTSGPEGLP
jgi:hypothetical protein